MRAVVYERYGPPDVLELREVPTPVPRDNELLVRVVATSVNRSDWETLVGKPLYARIGGMRRPRRQVLGSDVAGVVEQVGSDVDEFEPGDEILGDLLGHGAGGFSEYVRVPVSAPIIPKPTELSFARASTLPQAGIIALQGITGQVQEGDSVLINGGGGGTGAFAIQLAKGAGGDVTAVDNGLKQDFMRSLGADHTIDYTRTDYTRTGDRYDVILDMQCERSMFAIRRAVAPGGRYKVVGGTVGSLLAASTIAQLLRAGDRRFSVLMVRPSKADLTRVTQMVVEGSLETSIEKTYPLDEVPEALAHMGSGSALGKLVIEVG